MIANFFQSLNDHGVAYLLIGGQATVLYGAATFSEDLDVWIEPAAPNAARFLDALRVGQARYYKLTPPFTEDFLQRGHGFHFVLPAGTQPPIFVDVMGQPPRVGSFDTVRAAATWMDTDWGRIPTLGVKDLVELKKTQRLEDYPIISRLALAWFEQPQVPASAQDYRWAVENIFALGELRRLLQEHGAAADHLPDTAPAALREFARQVRAGDEASEQAESELTAWMQQRIQHFQQADRRYWRAIISELRQLRAKGQWVPEDSPV